MMTSHPHENGPSPSEAPDRSNDSFVVTFDSTHDAIAAQKTLGTRGYQVIPTPTEISTGCGIALRFHSGDILEVKSLLEKAGLSEGEGRFVIHRR